MAKRGPGRLSPLKLRQLAKQEGLHADGGNLYLQVTRGKHGLRQSWIFMFGLNGRQRSMGGGSLHTVSLAQAREWAREQRLLRLQGVDPIEHRKVLRQAVAREATKAKTFDEVSAAYLNEHQAKWRSAESGREWLSSMKRYVTPVFGKTAVKDVDLALVIAALEPIWNQKPVTAGRVRSRVEAVLDFAAVSGLRDENNPARWSMLSKRFARRSQLAPVVHHPAMKYAEVPAFLTQLRDRTEAASAAIQFVILTCSRRGEVLGARWDEIDFEGRVWEVPAERMKGRRQHRVPLSAAAMAVLERQHAIRQNESIFPGASRPRVSPTAVDRLLERMGCNGVLHGFRSSFADWRAERTNYDAEVAEACLAHALPSKTQAAYQRGTMFEKRRRVMDSWAAFLSGAEHTADVTPLRAVS